MPCKWNKIIRRTPNMYSSLLYIYMQYLNNELDLNPIYQRDLVWTIQQKQSYIQNIFVEKATISPTFILNWSSNKLEVLDGKQRLSTLFEFIENKLQLQDGKYFEDLSMKDCNFFLGQNIRYTRIEKMDEKDLTLKQKIELFLEINELGTKMSEEHLIKVKELI